MATVSVADLVSRVSVLLTDTTHVRWPSDELVNYLNDGQREIALYKPNAYVKNITLQLVTGTKQTLPADGISLVDITRNMLYVSEGVTTPGDAIRVVSKEILDAQIPKWHGAQNADVTVLHYTYTPLDPKTFYVYPPVPETGVLVEMIYVASPVDATSSGLITLDDIYMTALMDYMMYRAYSKDVEYAANAEYAKNSYAAFMAILAGKTNAENMSNPNFGLAPFNPNVPAGQK